MGASLLALAKSIYYSTYGVLQCNKVIYSRCNNHFVGSSHWFGKNCIYPPWNEEVVSVHRLSKLSFAAQ